MPAQRADKPVAELPNEQQDAMLPSPVPTLLYGHLLCNKASRKILTQIHLHAALCHRQGIRVHGANAYKGNVPKALKAFAKEIGVPDTLICNAACKQVSKEIRSFCHKIGTTL